MNLTPINFIILVRIAITPSNDIHACMHAHTHTHTHSTKAVQHTDGGSLPVSVSLGVT